MIKKEKYQTVKLPLKIYLSGAMLNRVKDANGDYVVSECWDADTSWLEANDEQLQTDKDGEKYYVYEP